MRPKSSDTSYQGYQTELALNKFRNFSHLIDYLTKYVDCAIPPTLHYLKWQDDLRRHEHNFCQG